MISLKPTADTETARYEDELRLTTYLFQTVKDGLTGQSLPEIVDDMPLDVLHAGVLLPQRPSLLPASQPDEDEDALSGLTDPAEAGTASMMGLDFQWGPESAAPEAPVTVEVRARLSLYYAVIPTYAEAKASALQAGQSRLIDDEEAEDEDLLDQGDEAEGAEMEATAAPQNKDSSPQQTRPPKTGTGAVLADVEMPAKFRRKDVALEPLTLEVGTGSLPGFVSASLGPALASAARDIMVSDLECFWSRERLRLPPSALDSEESYRQALDARRRPDGPLPMWSGRVELQALEQVGGGDGQNLLRLHVTLVNETPEETDRTSLLQPAFFNVGFEVAVASGEIVPFEFFGTPDDYRIDRSFVALGTNCVAEERGGGVLGTETVPLYRQSWTRTTERVTARFDELGTSAGDPLRLLDTIADRMADYLAEWDDFLTGPETAVWNEATLAACVRDRDAFAGERDTFLLGIECLRRDERLQRSFQLMNDCFEAQGRERGIVAWRLFQLAYIVSQLPSLAARELDSADKSGFARRLREAQAKVGVLLFPTGGGKTEAYLGLIVLSLFFDRLRGKARGVTAWMRFPLRMLSLQQLDRLARVLAEAERIRGTLRELDGVDNDPFAIGYFVGSGNTPNRLRPEDAERIEREGYQPLFPSCPFCGDDVVIRMDRDGWRLRHVCRNDACYTNTSPALGSAQGALPVYIVDNEVYRYRPSVLVGTVDKLAILAFHRNFAQLIRDVEGRCPKHGYFSFGECIEKERSGVCKVSRRQYQRHLPREKDPGPSLLIQDEMHLLNEEMGTFNGHYEGFLRHAAERDGNLPPKILGATATIQAYERHIFHLYLKEANRFPVPGWKDGETFYSTRQPHRDRRLYAGVLSHRRTGEESVIRCLTLYQNAVRALATDPAAVVGMLRLTTFTPDELADFLHLYDFSLAYVNRKATGGDLQFGIERGLRRAHIGAQDMQVQENRLDRALFSGTLKGDNTLAEIRATINRIERERHDTGEERLDVLIATSLISHGVDVERINMMCLAGMPSRYAEYVQASSRSARNHVGLVFACFNRRDLRECAQYHYFPVNHRFLDRLVESVPINRFSSFAADKTVPGLLCGLLLCFNSRDKLQGSTGGRDYDDLSTFRAALDNQGIDKDVLRAALVDIILGNGQGISPVTFSQTRQAIEEQFETCWEKARTEYRYDRLRDAVAAITSFRDVDRMVDFVAEGGSAQIIDKL